MKKQGVVWIAVLLLAGSAWGQYGYLYQSGGWMFGADFIGQEGWMVGAGGAILHTQDGGRNWVFQKNIGGMYLSFSVPLNNVVFKTPRNGWICYDGFQWVLRTTDGGQFWATESLPVNGLYGSKMSFADTLQGWLVGGYGSSSGSIIATTDGGLTWVVQSQNHPYFGVFAASPRQCWAVGGLGWTARTTDSGQNWFEQQLSPNSSFNDVFFPDTLTGWACGYQGAIVRTTDGGVTWSQQPSGTGRELTRLAFLDRSRGFAVGDSGTLIKTTDGGASWSSVATGVSATFFDLTFGDSLNGWAIGVEGGVILATSDGGTTWGLIQQGPAGRATTERLQAISFMDDSIGWAASFEGNIWHTRDGGKIWNRQISVTPQRLLGLTMANVNTGWAVGNSGLILSTQNGGATWTPQASGTQRSLWNVFASDAQHAWASAPGRTVFQTSNGGSRWDSIALAWPDSGVSGLASVDTLNGWALFSDGNVWATTNSGRTWSSRGRIGSLGWRHLGFVDPVWGWAAGERGIVRSTDGGRTWQSQSAYRMKDIAGATRNKAWAVGDSGRILATTDGGATWVPQNSKTTQNLLAVSFADSLNGIVGSQGYFALVTRNGGVVWDTVRVANTETRDIFLVNSLLGWAVGDNYIQRTTDGGYTWQTVLNRPNLSAVHFANPDTGWVAQTLGSILRTTDGGSSWDSTTGCWRAGDVRLLNGRYGWCGFSYFPPITSRLKVTFDRGNNWYTYDRPPIYAQSFKTGSPVGTTTGLFAGLGDKALRTFTDLSWDLVPLIAESSNNWNQYHPILWGMDFLNAQTGWAVGRKGAVMATTNGGMDWRLLKLDRSMYPVDSLLTSVQALDPLTARATGYLGRSVLTTDGGMTWVGEETGTDGWMLTSSFLSPTLGWVAGENGMVLKYGLLPSGVEAERGVTSSSWVTGMEQNRPNPFRDKTGIRYQVARKEHVRLIVYNVLGQAVRRLVDGTQTPGAYVISWDGRDQAEHLLPSGVYFYRLVAGGQSQTRKLVKVR